jgi:hypothetical protein
MEKNAIQEVYAMSRYKWANAKPGLIVIERSGELKLNGHN